ncbi:MAG: Flp family type IVb pilin [Microthrixaceae bacterium]
MSNTCAFVVSWLRGRISGSERGASLVEYALLVALIAVVCVVAVQVLGTQASASFSSTGSGLTAAN